MQVAYITNRYIVQLKDIQVVGDIKHPYEITLEVMPDPEDGYVFEMVTNIDPHSASFLTEIGEHLNDSVVFNDRDSGEYKIHYHYAILLIDSISEEAK